jgi:hypothetical protein
MPSDRSSSPTTKRIGQRSATIGWMFAAIDHVSRTECGTTPTTANGAPKQSIPIVDKRRRPMIAGGFNAQRAAPTRMYADDSTDAFPLPIQRRGNWHTLHSSDRSDK